MYSIMLLVSFILQAYDENGMVSFSSITYPLNYTISVDEKTYILYETPLSQNIDRDFNSISVQGKVSSSKVSFEVWLPQKNTGVSNKDEARNEITYTIVKPSSYKIYPNGRFWARFDIKDRATQFKFVVINRGVESKKFEINIYEINISKISKKKVEKEILFDSSSDESNLNLPQSLPFKLVRRNEWNANPPTQSYIKHTPKRITIHHTGANYPTKWEDALTEIKVIQEYHQQGRGWIDIGYHFLIDPQGNIFEGRPILAVGAHVANYNPDNIGISVMGNYHPPVNNKITEKTISSIITLARYLKEQYEIQKTSFCAHRDLANTDCPGDNIYAKMDYLKSKIFNKTNKEVRVEVDLGDEKLNERILRAISEW